jgi:outer membrane protein
LLLILTGLAAQAQTAPAAPPAAVPPVPQAPPNPGTKVGAIDFRQALTESDAGKAAVAEYNKEMAPLTTKLEGLQKTLTELQTKLQSAQTDAERSSIGREIDAKKIEFDRANQDAQRSSDDLQQRLLPPIANLVRRMVEEYAKENNLAIVLDPTTEPSNIIYRNPASDITAEIMRRMNAEYQKNPKLTVPGAAAPAPPAKPQP